MPVSTIEPIPRIALADGQCAIVCDIVAAFQERLILKGHRISRLDAASLDQELHIEGTEISQRFGGGVGGFLGVSPGNFETGKQ